MIDLDVLRTSSSFSVEDSPRLAFVHHGFQSTLVQQGQSKRADFVSHYPPLGLLALMRQLAHDEHEGLFRSLPKSKYFDEASYQDDNELVAAVKDWLAPTRFRLLLLGVYTSSLERVLQFINHFERSEVCVVVGGAHVANAPDLGPVHLAVRGEGGIAVRHILNELLRPGFAQGPDANGICFVDRGVSVFKKAAFNQWLAEIPAPAYDYSYSALPARAHWTRDVGSSQQIYVCTQNCAARCTFCSTYFIHGPFVSRPASKVKADIQIMVQRFGYDAIEFHDDDLLQHKDFDDILNILQEASVLWSCNARTQFMTVSLAKRMYDAGCRRIFLGLESLDQATLDYFRKGCTVLENERAVWACNDAEIGIICGFIIGAPHHTIDAVLAELDGFLKLPIYFLAPSILTPDVGTVEYLRARAENNQLRLLENGGRGLGIRPRPDIFGSQMPYGLPTVCETLTKPQLNELYESIQCEFFLRADASARIFRLTPKRCHDKVRRWYSCLEEKARELEATAKIEQVRLRLKATLIKWFTHSGGELTNGSFIHAANECTSRCVIRSRKEHSNEEQTKFV